MSIDHLQKHVPVGVNRFLEDRTGMEVNGAIWTVPGTLTYRYEPIRSDKSLHTATCSVRAIHGQIGAARTWMGIFSRKARGMLFV